ncbi:MAG: site-specific integrase, partial [Thermoguttaceae bacterium]
MPKTVSLPKYCLHKARGLAYMRVQGKFIYLGEYDSPESKQEYGRIIAEMAAYPSKAIAPKADIGLTIVELCTDYREYAKGYYLKNGRPTSQVRVIHQATKEVSELYSRTPVDEFGPLALQAVQAKLIAKNRSRKTVNQFCETIKRMFKWAVSKQLVPVTVYQALLTVRGIPQGRGMARETAPIGPVAVEVIEATLPYLSAIVADMVHVQRLTGARPGEVCQIRPQDVDRSGEIWEYRPASHKTEHHGKQRVIYIGPQAQAVLRPYLLRSADAYCFQPAESEDKRHIEQRAKRRSKVQPSQQHRCKARHRRPPLTAYTKDSYGRAIRRAVVKANKVIKEDALHMGIDNPV